MKAGTLACLQSLMEAITGLVRMLSANTTLKLSDIGFAYYFEEQNAAIKKKELHAEEINLVALGINNGQVPASSYNFSSRHRSC